MTKASDNSFPSLLITEGTEPAAPAAGKQRLYIDSTTHLLKLTNSSGTDSNVGGHIVFAKASKTSGNTTLNSTTEASVDTGLDLTLAAASGDIAEVWVNGLWGNENQIANLDVATIVSAAPVSYFGPGLASSVQGLLGWSKQNAGSLYEPLSGSAHLVLGAGDISGGNVVLRLRYKVNGNSVTLFSSSNTAFYWGAKIIRPV